MLRLFLKWLKEICGIKKEQIRLDIYIHENNLDRVPEVKIYWSDKLKVPIELFQAVYFKRHGLSTRRKNIGKEYHGLVLVRVKASTDLNRKIAGWIDGICKRVLNS